MTSPKDPKQPMFPKYPKTLAECIAASSDTDDGIYIAGHTFGQVIAFQDEKTGRYYMVDICMECGKPEVMFVEAVSNYVKQAEDYPVFKVIGGERE